MSRLGPGAAVLFWLMCAASGASLALWLILPAWVEYQAACDAVERARGENLALRQQLTASQRQIEHLLHDRDYQERVAQGELGFERPDVERLIVQPAPTASSTPADAARQAAAGQAGSAGAACTDETPLARAQGLAAWLAEHARGNRFLAIYVLDETRPIVFLISLVALLAAIVLLNNRWSLSLGRRVEAPAPSAARRSHPT